MDVGFLMVGEQPCVATMVRSVRRVIPNARIVQMSDKGTPEVPGVDEVRRLPYDGYLMKFRLKHLADWPHEQALILDTDVIVKADVSDVFDQPFDLALTRRSKPEMSADGVDMAKRHPYNCGVMFSRSPAFWLECYRWLQDAKPKLWGWWGDQEAVINVAPRYNILDLPVEEFNWSPSGPEELSDARIWHYKGAIRKQWMLDIAAYEED